METEPESSVSLKIFIARGQAIFSFSAFEEGIDLKSPFFCEILGISILQGTTMRLQHQTLAQHFIFLYA